MGGIFLWVITAHRRLKIGGKNQNKKNALKAKRSKQESHDGELEWTKPRIVGPYVVPRCRF